MSARAIRVAVAAGAALAVAAVLALALRDPVPDGLPPADAAQPARSHASVRLAPVVHRFGERVTATLELLVPKRELQPDTLRGIGAFDPYEVVGAPVREIFDVGDRYLVRFTVQLECLKQACLPQGRVRTFEPETGAFTWRTPPPPGRRFRDRGRDNRSASFDWGALTVTSRLGPDDVQNVTWRSALGTLPEPSYRMDPQRLFTLLLAAAVAAVFGAAALAGWWLRRERLVVRAEVEGEPPPSPLAQALALVAAEAEGDGRRLALETLAQELRAAGEPALAAEAERLAWSEDEPDARLVGALVQEAGA